ncbi:TnpV protein, partial [Dysosmobacter welbionis]
ADSLTQQQRADRHDAQINGAEQGDLAQDFLDEVHSGLAGTESRDKAALLLQVVGDLHRIELDGGVEIAETDDHDEIHDHIDEGLGIDGVVDCPGNRLLLGNTDEGPDRHGQRRDALGE